MKILFICRHNRFRSKVAEALFNKYDNKRNEVKSAGVMLDPISHFVAPEVVRTLAEKGAKVESDKSRVLDQYLINWADKIVIAADNVPRDIFLENKDVEVWKISDCSQDDGMAIRERVEIIDGKIKRLIEKIKV